MSLLYLHKGSGFDFWPGPYGNWGSRKYLMASLDSSHSVWDWSMWMYFTITVLDLTPLEETMGALSDMVRQGKALYVGISNYQAEEAEAAIRITEGEQTLVRPTQPRYNMFERWRRTAFRASGP